MSDTYWQDIADEVFVGAENVAGRAWKEATMQDDSWNQKACEGFADVLTAGAGCGSYAAAGASAAAEKAKKGAEAVGGWADDYRDFDSNYWPYG